MTKDGVSWTPCVAGIAAASLLGFGVTTWIAAPLAAAGAVLGGHWARARQRRPLPAAEVATLQRALLRRNEHLAQTVHELRTPLCSVVAALELLRGDWVTDAHETAEVLAEATMAAHHLTDLVDDVLDDAALTAGRLRLQLGSHRVTTLLDDSRRLLRLHAERRGVPLEIEAADASLAVRTDPRRFRQVVCNLVGNALKVAPRGTAVQLRVEANAHRVRFLIVDDGPGIGRELQQRLFAPFAAGGSAPGTGLGLHVSMRLVHQMGGRIGHESPARGAVFWFELPRAAARTPPHIVVAPVAAAAR